MVTDCFGTPALPSCRYRVQFYLAADLKTLTEKQAYIMMFESQKRVVEIVQSLKFPKIKKIYIHIYVCLGEIDWKNGKLISM